MELEFTPGSPSPELPGNSEVILGEEGKARITGRERLGSEEKPALQRSAPPWAMLAAASLPLFSWLKGARGGLPRVPRNPQINRGGSPSTVGSSWGLSCGQGTSQQLQEHRLLLSAAGLKVPCVGTEFNTGLTDTWGPGEPHQHHTRRPCQPFQKRCMCAVGGRDLHRCPTPKDQESVEKGFWLQGTWGERGGLLRAGLSHLGRAPVLGSESPQGRNRENSRPLFPPV